MQWLLKPAFDLNELRTKRWASNGTLGLLTSVTAALHNGRGTQDNIHKLARHGYHIKNMQ